MSNDFNLYKALWENINDVVVPDPPPNQEAKACLLLESPGFSITSDYYDEDSYQKKYTSDHSRPSPDYLTAQLCDKVPALSDYYYDTGDHISFKWRQLLQTYWLTYRPADDRNLKERYEKAIEMLYVNYAKQEKTQLYKEVDTLLEKWQEAMRNKERFYQECVGDNDEDGKGATYFETNAGPYIEEVEQALSEYEQLKRQIRNYEAAIYEYTSGDLGVVVEDAVLDMAEHKRYDAGSDGSGSEFYKTTLDPADWFKWFEKDYKDTNGWTSVTISSKKGYKSSRDTFSSLSTQASASYGGLFYSGSASASYSKSQGSSSATSKNSDLTISFSVRKVNINRPWLDRTLLEYPTLGIRELPRYKWSNGSLNAKTNKGSFPLLPTAFIVARDVTISNFQMNTAQNSAYKKTKTDASMSVSIGCFSASGSFSQQTGSQSSSSSYDEQKKELKITGSQIIGWVCSVIPPFPQVEQK